VIENAAYGQRRQYAQGSGCSDASKDEEPLTPIGQKVAENAPQLPAVKGDGELRLCVFIPMFQPEGA
jgi:hypothetical protein